ncbi:hypothetical protein ACLGC3_01325 [Helicobacter pylori]
MGKNVRLLEQALEIYSIQTKASAELVKGAWNSVKKSLSFYTDKHQEFIKRLNYASAAIDNEYNIAPPESLKERDFESPTIVYSPKKSVYDECLKDLREDFSFSLYADLKNRINAYSKSDRATNSKEHELDLMSGVHSYDESFNLAKKHCAKNFKEALQDFAEKIKKSPNDLNAVNEAFNHLKTELERVSDDERLKGLRENLASLYADLYADLKDKIHHNALSSDDLERMASSRGQEFEKNLEDLMPSSLGVHSYDESFNLAKKHCAKNFKEALQDFAEKIKKSPNDLNAVNEAFNHLKTELERVSDDERLKGLRENLASLYADLYADLKDKIHHNALSSDDLERMASSRGQEFEKNLEDLMPGFRGETNALSSDDLERMASSRGQEFEKNLEDLMPSSLGVHSYDESFNLAKKHCAKNFKEALQDFAEKIQESPNDLNAVNEAFNHLKTELERATENLSQKIAPILERYENDKHHALGYGEFLEKEKEGFMVDEQNPYPEEVRFNGLRLAEFDSVFSAIVPLGDLDKTACTHPCPKGFRSRA